MQNDADALASRIFVRVSSTLEVKHKEVCEQVAMAVRSDAEGFNEQIVGSSPEQRRLNERIVQMQIGIDKNAAGQKGDMA